MIRIHNRLARGFTLVELLTVIAIVGILSAIIIPVTASARASAKRAGCLSNLRQIAGALQLYANDHRGHYPAASSPGSDPDNPTAGASRWNRDIEDYLPRRRATNNSLFEHEVFVCPAAVSAGGLSGKDLKMTYNATQAIYGFSGTGLSRFAQRHVNSIAQPAQTPLVYEGALLTNFDVQTNYYHTWAQVRSEVGKDVETLNRANGVFDFRHKGSMNVCMADGSARTVQPEWLGTLNQSLWEGRE